MGTVRSAHKGAVLQQVPENGKATHVWAPRESGPYYDARDLQKSVAGAANRLKNSNAKINANGKLVAEKQIPTLLEHRFLDSLV